MNVLGIGLLVLGLIVIGMGLLDWRWGNKGWRLRVLTGLAPINGIGRFPHPPFPTSLVASVTAGIGEELIFRLFFTSFWT